jgi:hypothetical protein
LLVFVFRNRDIGNQFGAVFLELLLDSLKAYVAGPRQFYPLPDGYMKGYFHGK